MDRLVYKWDELIVDTSYLAGKLMGYIGMNQIPQFKQIVAITKGGLIPTAMMARWSPLSNLPIDTLGIHSYTDEQTQEKDITITKLSKSNDYTLLVDDVVDSGRTMQLARECYPNSYFVSLFWKRNKNYQPDLFLRETDKWIVFPWEL